MSEAWLYGDEGLDAAGITTRAKSAGEAAPRTSLEKWARRIALALVILLGLEAIWFCLVVPCLPFAKVSIAYTGTMPREQLLAVAGIDARSSWLGLNAESAEQALEALPTIADAELVKVFPDRLELRLLERTAVAIALTETNGRIETLSLDREGVVFSVGADAAASLLLSTSSLPVISGLMFEHPQPGVRLPDFLSEFLADLDRLERTAPALLGAISEIRIQKRAYDSYELVLYPVNQQVRVRVGPRLNEETLQYMMLVLDVLASRGIQTDEIDFRTGTAVYREKEASSG